MDRKKPKTEIRYNITLNEEQRAAKEAILNRPITILHGLAGSGKTITACMVALDMLFKKDKSKIVVTRPTVGTEDNGFLPGTFQEKLEPWLVPIRDNLKKSVGNSEKIAKLEQDEHIEIVALTHFRGRTFDDAVCIIDEYQNLTVEQFKMCIGRLGKNSIMIFCGDPNQTDLKKMSSATACIEKIANSPFVNVVELKQNHRHEAVLELLKLLN